MNVVSGEIIFYIVSKIILVSGEIIFYILPKINVVSVVSDEIISYPALQIR